MADLAREVIERAIAQKQLLGQLHSVDEAHARALADSVIVDADTSPSAGAGIAIALTRFGAREENRERKANHVYKSIKEQSQKVQAGDLSFVSELLVSQAHSLNSLFNELLKDAALSSREARAEYLRLALQAQNQSLKTARALGEIHNPKRTVFVKNQQNNLHLEAPNNAPLDGTSPIAAGRADQTVETLGTKHRPQERSR